jgi:uncharacterized damage-inducible protein DinB
MELTGAVAATYVRVALEQMGQVVDRLDDARVNERPPGPDTNSVAVLVAHCAGVGEFWLGHVGLGRPSDRDRDAEFRVTLTVAELHRMLGAMGEQIVADVLALDAGEASDTYRAGRAFLERDDESDAALVVHVLEELYQHLGQMELTADALGAGR